MHQCDDSSYKPHVPGRCPVHKSDRKEMKRAANAEFSPVKGFQPQCTAKAVFRLHRLDQVENWMVPERTEKRVETRWFSATPSTKLWCPRILNFLKHTVTLTVSMQLAIIYRHVSFLDLASSCRRNEDIYVSNRMSTRGSRAHTSSHLCILRQTCSGLEPGNLCLARPLSQIVAIPQIEW